MVTEWDPVQGWTGGHRAVDAWEEGGVGGRRRVIESPRAQELEGAGVTYRSNS